MSDSRIRRGCGRRSATVLVVWVAAVFLLFLLSGCATAQGQRDQASVGACVPAAGELSAGATLEAAAGAYRLTLVNPRANGAPSTVTGTLRLEPNEPPLHRHTPARGVVDETVAVPLYGWADVDLSAVDALEIGNVGSQDPLRPGVLVLEQRPGSPVPASITLRLGSLANRRDGRSAIDGGYTALHVLRVEAAGSFAGTWASGVHGRRVEGHFCATPVPAADRDELSALSDGNSNGPIAESQ